MDAEGKVETIPQMFDRLCLNPARLALEEADALNVDMDDLQEDLQQQCARWCVWANLAAEGHARWQSAKDNAERVEAEAGLRVRERIDASGQKSTEGRVAQLTVASQECVDAKADVVASWLLWQKFKNVADAVFMRKDMIQSINARQQREASFYAREHSRGSSEETLEELKQRYQEQKRREQA